MRRKHQPPRFGPEFLDLLRRRARHIMEACPGCKVLEEGGQFCVTGARVWPYTESLNWVRESDKSKGGALSELQYTRHDVMRECAAKREAAEINAEPGCYEEGV